MHIGIDARFLSHQAFATRGMGRYTRGLLSALLNLDDKNQYTIFAKEPTDLKNSLKGKKNKSSTFVEKLGIPKFSKKGILVNEIFYPLELYKHHFDATHFLFGEIAPIIKPSPSIVTVHDITAFLFLDQSTHSFRLNLRRKMLELNLKKSDMIVAISESTKSDLMKFFGLRENKIQVISNGVEDIFRPTKRVDSKKFIFDKYKIKSDFFLYVGGFNETKNLLSLINIFVVAVLVSIKPW